jgi:hypothetical protein
LPNVTAYERSYSNPYRSSERSVITAPDRSRVRAESLAELHRLQLPVPPRAHPFLWQPGDSVGLRALPEIEARTAILSVCLARASGVAREPAARWCKESGLVTQMTAPEWEFVSDGTGDVRSFALHLEALFALAWLLGIALDLDPLRPAPESLRLRLPDVAAGETFAEWQHRTLTAPRSSYDTALARDLYFCLDWAFLECERTSAPLPGRTDSNAIGQRRWALDWAVVFTGPSHGPPPGWEDIEL